MYSASESPLLELNGVSQVLERGQEFVYGKYVFRKTSVEESSDEETGAQRNPVTCKNLTQLRSSQAEIWTWVCILPPWTECERLSKGKIRIWKKEPWKVIYPLESKTTFYINYPRMIDRFIFSLRFAKTSVLLLTLCWKFWWPWLLQYGPLSSHAAILATGLLPPNTASDLVGRPSLHPEKLALGPLTIWKPASFPMPYLALL